jgi:hypothetical protein
MAVHLALEVLGIFVRTACGVRVVEADRFAWIVATEPPTGVDPAMIDCKRCLKLRARYLTRRAALKFS